MESALTRDNWNIKQTFKPLLGLSPPVITQGSNLLSISFHFQVSINQIVTFFSHKKVVETFLALIFTSISRKDT